MATQAMTEITFGISEPIFLKWDLRLTMKMVSCHLLDVAGSIFGTAA